MKKQKGLYRKKPRTSLKKRKKEKTGRTGGQKNEGRMERLKAFIHDKETKSEGNHRSKRTMSIR
jgi:hypothetical protein